MSKTNLFFGSMFLVYGELKVKCKSCRLKQSSLTDFTAALVSSQIQLARSVHHNNNKRLQSMPLDRESLKEATRANLQVNKRILKDVSSFILIGFPVFSYCYVKGLSFACIFALKVQVMKYS